MLNRSLAPAIKDALQFDISLKPITNISLSNGVPLYYLNSESEEVVFIDFAFHAGITYEPQIGIASATSFLIKNGTSRKNAYKINETFELYGAYLTTKANENFASLSLHCLSKHVKILLPLIRELLTDAVFPENEVDIYKRNSLQVLDLNLKKPDFVADRSIDMLLYGPKHPYGRAVNHNNIKSITRKELLAFYKKFYLKGRCSIFAAGKLPADFEKQIDKNFGDLPINKKVEKPTFRKRPARERNHFIDVDNKGLQGSIRIARPFISKRHPDYKKAVVLNTVFGGYFGSRLMSNIREEKGYTYGIHSYFDNHLEDSCWMISTEAGKEVCKATIREVYKEMKRLNNKQVNAEELLLVKNYMMGVNLGYIDGALQTMSRWRNLILNGLDETYFNDSIEAIREVTAKELQLLARKYLNPDEFYELLVI